MLIGRTERTITRDEFLDYFDDLRQLDPKRLPRGGGPEGNRAFAFRATQEDRFGDPVLHSEAGWEALWDLFADKYAGGGGDIVVRDGNGQLNEVGRRLLEIDHISDNGDRFWGRPEVLNVRVKGLPQNVDGGTLRSGGIEVPGAQLSMWFGGPNSETLGNVVLQGASWAVEHEGVEEFRISGNNSLWDACPTWRIETDDANILPIESGGENLKLAQNNRDPLCGVRRMLSRELYELAGVPIGRARPAEVSLQFGDHFSFQGHRTLIEPPESTIRRHFTHNDRGNLYELTWTDNGPANLTTRPNESTIDLLNRKKDIYDLKGRNDRRSQTNDRSDLATLMDRLNADTNDPNYAKNLEEVLDVKAWLRALAVSVATGNWDGFVDTASNGYLYNGGRPENADDGRYFFMEKPYFTFIPNDTDNSLGSSPIRDGAERNFAYADMFHPQDHMPGGPEMPMIEKILSVGEFRDYYVEFMKRFLDRVFNPDVVEDLVGTKDGGNGDTGFWPQIRDVAYREGNFSEPPRTQRWHSNDAVFNHGVNHQELHEGWRKLYGIDHHVNMAHDHLSRMVDRYQPSDPGRRFSEEEMPIGKPTPVRVG